MNRVMECAFLHNAVENASDKECIISAAEKCGCCGECTLENGCILYKTRHELQGEKAFFETLKSEFLDYMLGE